jgi:hypothetical protein
MLMQTLALTASLLFTGCSSVTTSFPISADPQPIDHDKFEGSWMVDKGAVSLQFSSNGVARLAGVEWKDDRFRMVQGEMIVAKGKKDSFISLRFEDDGVWTNSYYLLQYHFTDQGELLLWSPNAKAFEAAVATNRLLGVVSKSQYSIHVDVTNSPAALIEFIETSGVPDLFDYREPTVLRKIAPAEKSAPPRAP